MEKPNDFVTHVEQGQCICPICHGKRKVIVTCPTCRGDGVIAAKPSGQRGPGDAAQVGEYVSVSLQEAK